MLRRTALLCAGVIVTALACSEDGTTPSGVIAPPAGAMRSTIGGFSCALSYHAITQTNEAELTAHGVEPTTDTAHICETWTGSDYQAEVTQIGSSEPPSDFSEDVKTVVYQNGATSAYNATGTLLETQPVGATSFEFVAATEDERQASYSDPYYGVVQANHECDTPPTCVYIRQAEIASAGGTQDVVQVPFKRLVLKHLLKGRAEIAPSIEGWRRFRKVEANGDETTISVDPLRELIRRQESKTKNGTTRADLTWVEFRGKYVRERLEMVNDETVRSKRRVSSTSVVLRNVQWDPGLIK